MIISVAEFAQFFFFVVVLFFLVTTLALGYHWFEYGTDRRISMITLATYLLLSAPCLLAMSLSIYMM